MIYSLRMNCFMKFFFVGLVLLLFSCSEERESTFPRNTDVVESVYSSVVLEPQGSYKVVSSVPGFIDRFAVIEGGTVEMNGTICFLKNDPAVISEQNASLGYDLIRQNLQGEANMLEEMRLELQSLKSKMKTDSVNAQRYRSLYDKQAVSKSDMERFQLIYEQTQVAFNSLQNRYKRTKSDLSNQLSQAGNNRKLGGLRTADYTIRSAISGKVFQLLKEPGEYVNMQEPIAVVGNGTDFQLKMLVDEIDIGRIRIGQKVLVRLEAYRGNVYEAKLSYISPKMDEKTQTFEVHGKFVKAPQKMYMGLTGEGNIIVDEKKAALVIPRSYLQAGNMVETDKGLVKVITGMSNWDDIEIVSGITKETRIYKPK